MELTASVQKAPFVIDKINIKQKVFFSWPNNLDILKLTSEEVRDIEYIALYYMKNLPESTNTIARINNVVMNLKSGTEIRFENGERKKLPRSLIVTQNKVIVQLNSKGGMVVLRGGGQQKNLKFAYEAIKGKFLIKKHISNQFEFNFYQYLYALPGQERKGFAKIYHARWVNGKASIWEKYYPNTLSIEIRNNRNLSCRWIVHIWNAIAKIHNLAYYPAIIKDGTSSYSFESKKRSSFYGDISPNNIMCEKQEGKIYPKYKLIDYGATNNFDHIIWTRGWGSPETIQYSVTKKKYQNLTAAEFNEKYGQKKDVWALALLLGSLLRGTFHKKYPEFSLPCFSFIVKKLKITENRIDDSRLARLKQRVIDKSLDKIINKIDESAPHGATLRKMWMIVKAFLIVKPDLRPSLKQIPFSLEVLKVG